MELFSQLELPRKTLKNRIAASVPNSFLADNEGSLTQDSIDYYHRIAQTDVSIVISEGVSIVADRLYCRQPFIDGTHFRERFSLISKAIRSCHSIPILSLFHPGINALPRGPETRFQGPSKMFFDLKGRQIQELSYEQVDKLTRQFLDAAISAWNSGFSGVEVSAADGTLLQQFLSPLFNHRNDSYGFANGGGQKVILEIMQAMRKALPDFLLIVKIAARDLLPGGKSIKETFSLCKKLEEIGIDLIHITSGFNLYIPEYAAPNGKNSAPACFADDCQFLKNGLNVPVILSGRIDTPALAEELVRKNITDAVALGRTLVRDFDWLKKARLNSTNIEIRKCKRCLVCGSPAFGCPDCQGILLWKLEKTKLGEINV